MKKIYLFLILSVFILGARSQSVVISQIYGGGGNAGAPYQNDYVELFNATSSAVNITGWSIQYAATAGTTWNKATIPTFTLQPGQYFLYKLVSGGANGVALPTEDASNGVINMSGSNGKLALVNNNTTITSGISCPSGSSIVDFVGFGTANCFEGAAAAPAGSNTLAMFRALNGCQDTQVNSADFTTGTPNPRNSSSTLNPCFATCTVPTQKPTNIRYGGSPSSTSMTVYFTRGNGTGSLVLCKQGSAVNASPVSGTSYTANTNFGSGSQIGTGNYAVFSTTYKDVNAFTLTGLTAGTKYYFSVFEYNDPGKCYTSTGLVDSFTVGGTLLKPGDMAFVGWDNAADAGEDKLYIMNMVDITKGTKFSLVNSRFEAGAAANVRTNKWYGGSTDPYQDPEMLDFEYVGTTIAKGSIISMESNSSSGFTNFTINGSSVPASDFSATTGFSNFLSTTGSDADQLYITQGKFTAYGTAGVDRYNLFNGLVIHGITTRTPWVPLTSAVSTGGGASRESRIPPDIFCFSVEFGTNTLGYGAYKHSAGIVGTKEQLLTNIKNLANWSTGAGANNVNDVIANEANVNSPFTINSGNADGQWLGNSTDWFDCNNWGGFHVPDSTTNTGINTTSTPFIPIIDVSGSLYAVQYSNIAHSNNLSISNNSNLNVVGAGNEKIVVEGDITINPGGIFYFDPAIAGLNDTMWIHKSITDLNTVATSGFQAGTATVILDEARTNITPYALSRDVLSTLTFNKLVVSNTRSVNLSTPVRVSNNLNLQNGYLNVVSPNGSLVLSALATVTSPANIYGQTDRGYYSSFVNGKMSYEAINTTTNRVFPIGKISTDTAFAPVELTRSGTDFLNNTYNAEYFPAPYADLTVDPGQLHHVSKLEYWNITSDNPTQVQVTLSWRPKSDVGDGTSNPVSFDSLMVAHYFDGGIGTPMWSVDGGSNIIMPKNAAHDFNYGLVTTIAYTSMQTYPLFTLGTRGPYNSLPVKLLSFTGAINKQKVTLQWLTTEEQFVDRYEVEKSTDAMHFSLLNNVNSVNAAAHHTYYSYDNNPAEGWNYYRLRVVGKDGKANYSTIVKVWYSQSGNFVIYPNPAKDELKINLPASSSISQIAIVNSEGQVVKQLATSEQSFTINIESLSKGVYFIRILNSRQAIAQKFIKQ